MLPVFLSFVPCVPESNSVLSTCCSFVQSILYQYEYMICLMRLQSSQDCNTKQYCHCFTRFRTPFSASPAPLHPTLYSPGGPSSLEMIGRGGTGVCREDMVCSYRAMLRIERVDLGEYTLKTISADYEKPGFFDSPVRDLKRYVARHRWSKWSASCPSPCASFMI